MKRTLVVGASPNPDRYSFKATERLADHGHEVFPFGIRNGTICGIEIRTDWPEKADFHTVTLYMNPKRQVDFYQAIIDLHPARVIFNPGTENVVLQAKLNDAGIQWMEACTLVMLSIGNY